jgi:hypothetical protein
MFVWNREPDASALAALHRLAPPSPQVSHLTLFWCSGTPLAPIQRWLVYQAVPVRYLTEGRLAAFLAYAPCRCATRPLALSGWDRPCPRCGHRPSPERQQVLDYYLRTGCLAAPFWVVQGHAGGHKWKYSAEEAAWARWAGLPDEPPTAGDLAYAECDQRVIRKLRAHDLAQRAQAQLANASTVERRGAEQGLRKAMLAAYATEAEDTVRDGWSALSGVTHVTHDQPKQLAHDDDWVDEQFVETGAVHAFAG